MAAPERWGVSRNAQLGRGGECHSVAAPESLGSNVSYWCSGPRSACYGDRKRDLLEA